MIRLQVRDSSKSDPAFNAYGDGCPPWRSIGLKMSPVRRKFPPWELMARATKYEPQVGASGGRLAAYDVKSNYLRPMM